MSRWMLLTCLLALPTMVACGDKDEDEDEDDDEDGGSDDTGSSSDDTGDTGTNTCGGTAPVLENVTCRNAGKQDNGGTEMAVLQFSADVTDADADLNGWTITVSYDTEPDGTISASTELGSTSGGTGLDCQIPATEASAGWFVDGASLPYEVTWDFGVTVTDINGDVSDMSVITCQTPNSSGLGGGQVDLD